MSRTASELIKIAAAEVGYHEKASNSNLDSKTANSGSNNYTKYGRDLFAAGYYNGNKNGYAWCDQYVDWCFWQLCCKDKKAAEAMECQTGLLGAGCTYSQQYYKNAGRHSMTPQVGDQIFFLYSGSGADHTGIVVEVTASTVKTIEGNSGNVVGYHVYNRGDKTICGYGHPKYEAEAKPVQAAKEECEVKLPYLKNGSKGEAVRSIQRICKNLGYYSLNIDGDFGPRTVEAVKRLQAYLKVGVDGEVGSETYGALFK